MQLHFSVELIGFEFRLFSGAKRLHHTMNGPDDACSQSTGLTQEIDIMDIGSSTPKRKKSKSPLKGVLKIRYDQLTKLWNLFQRKN